MGNEQITGIKLLEAPKEPILEQVDPVEVQPAPVIPTKGEKKKAIREWRWWKTNPNKVIKLEQAFAIGCTDKEACGYADISKMQLMYYQRQHPEFITKKEVLKDQVVLLARQTVAKKVEQSYSTAMDYLKRMRKSEFVDTVDITSAGERIGGPVNNEIMFVNFDGSNAEDKL